MKSFETAGLGAYTPGLWRIRKLEALLRAERYGPDGKYIPRGIAGEKQ